MRHRTSMSSCGDWVHNACEIRGGIVAEYCDGPSQRAGAVRVRGGLARQTVQPIERIARYVRHRVGDLNHVTIGIEEFRGGLSVAGGA